jgi:hypothetical protein
VSKDFGILGQAEVVIRSTGNELEKDLERKGKFVHQTTESWGKGVAKIGAGFAFGSLITTATRQIVAFGAAVVEDADALVDLSNKTGASIQWLQKAGYAARQTGSDVNELAAAAFKLGVNIQKGSPDVRDAIRDIGLEYDTLKRMKPEEQFDAVAAALAKTENVQQRNTAGLALFGKSVQNILPMIVDNYTKLANAAPTAGDAQVKALGRASDAWDRFKDKVKSTATTVLGSMVLMGEKVGEVGVNLVTAPGKLFDWGRSMAQPGSFISKYHSTMNQFGGGPQGATASKPAEDLEIYTKRLKAAEDALGKLSTATKKQLDAGLKLDESVENLAERLFISEDVIELYKVAQDKATESQKKAADAAKEYAEGLREVSDQLMLISIRGRRMAFEGPESSGLAPVGVNDYGRGLPWMGALPGPIAPHLAGTMWDPIMSATPNYAYQVNQYKPPPRPGFNLSGLFGSDPGAFSKGFFNSILGATMGGGNIKKTMGSFLGGSLTQNLFGDASSGLGKTVSEGLTKGLGKTLGGAIGAFLPGIGTILGPMIGAGIGKLVTMNKNETKGGRGDFAKSLGFGNQDALFKHLRATVGGKEADELINRALNVIGRKDTEGNQKWMEDVNAALGRHKDLMDGLVPTWEEAQALAEQYGIDIAALGPKFHQGRLGAGAEEIVKTIKRLEAFGGDRGGILSGMSDEISAIVQEALKYGTELPSYLKPYVDELIKSGKLLDENGNKLEGLEGLTWAETMSEGFQKVIDKLDELIAKLSGVSSAAGGSDASLPGGGIDSWLGRDVPHLAGGGFANWGSGTLAMLHGQEAVIPIDKLSHVLKPSMDSAGLVAALRDLVAPSITFAPSFDGGIAKDYDSFMRILMPTFIQVLRDSPALARQLASVIPA